MDSQYKELFEKNLELTIRIEMLEFKTQLLFDNSRTSRLLFEYDITQTQYRNLMDLLDKYRKMLDKAESVSSSKFESEVYELIPELKGDYHFCEFFSQSLMEDGRWEEVFPALYGEMQKYKYYMENRKQGD